MMRRGLVARPPLSRGWGPLIAAGAIYTIILVGVIGLRVESSSDFRDFWRTAEHFQQTGQVRADFGVHNYLPFFVIFMAPWSLLPMGVAAALFVLLSMTLLGVTVAMLELLQTGGVGRAPRAATLIGLGLVLPYVHATAVLGQVNLLLLFLVVAAWLLAARGREWAAGLPLGLAVLIKLLPAALVVFFLLQRRWRVAVSAGVVCLLLGFGMPLASLGWQETLRQHRHFYDGAIVGHSAWTTLTAEKPIKAKYSNNSVPIVLRRVFSPVNGDPNDDGRSLLVNVADLSRPAIAWVYAGLMAILVGVAATLALRRGPHWPLSSEGDARRGNALFGLWCVLMLLASPLVWTHYLVLASPAIAVLADRLEREWLERRRVCRLAAVPLLAWAVSIGLLAWPAARAAGAQILGVAAVWAALASLIAGSGRRVGGPNGGGAARG